MPFQFTLPCRERQATLLADKTKWQFQFTLPCRERRCRLRGQTGCHRRFNSRSRVGSDVKDGDDVAGFGVSIHAPV